MKVALAVCSVLVLITCVEIKQVNSLNILGLFPFPGKSHFFVFERYLKELVKRGHNVTVISHFPQEDNLKNYHDISLANSSQILEDVFEVKKSYWALLRLSFALVEWGTDNCRVMLSNKNVQNAWETTKFDIVVTEQFNSDCSLGVAHHLKLPVIGLASHALMPWHYSRFGISFNPSYMSHMFLSGGTKPTLYERIERVLFESYLRLIYKFYSQRNDQNTLAQYFNDIPPLEELGRNIKFQLVYSYFVHFGSNLYPQNVIEVGGYHVQKPKKLPDDIRKFIEESPHGVIYISFGSMLRSATTPREKIETIISALKELPQRFIWKWEEDSLPGNPSNIYLSKWLPQNDILSHPNVLAFYSHSGLLGTSEALYHGVPMLAMPIFGDQPGNAAVVEESGLGVQIEFMTLTKEELLEKFKQILNPEFRVKVKTLSKAWKDRPISGLDTAIHWTEFAARYSNFTFRSAAANVPLYQYLGLDVFFILFVIPVLIFVVILGSMFSKKRETKAISNNKKKSKKE